MKSKQSNNKKMLSPFISLFLSPGTHRSENDLYINWSVDIPVAPASSLLCVPPASKHILLPHTSLCNTGPSGKSRVKSDISTPTLLDYSNDQLAITNFLDGTFYVVFIFRTEKTWSEDTTNIFELIKRIGSYIKSHPANINVPRGDFIPVIESL